MRLSEVVSLARDANDGPRRRLGLRLGIPDAGGRPDLYPVVKILIDGEETLANAGSSPGGYIGSPPAAILGENAPLLPAKPPRRVAVYVDSAGDPGGGCLAPVISGRDDVVTWTDFRNFMDFDEAPIIDERQGTSRAVALPDLVFDAGQYTAEVRRVTDAREWESDRWRTALLLDEYLSAGPLAHSQWQLGWVEPQEETAGVFLVTLFDEDLENGAVVTLKPGLGAPDEQARQMAEFLVTQPLGQWPVTRRIRGGAS